MAELPHPSPGTRHEVRHWHRWLWAIVIAAFALRAATLEHKGLWTDEFKTLYAVRLGLWEMIQERASGGHLPLYFIAVKCFRALFGEREAVLRLPSVLAGTLSVLWIGWLARTAWGARPALVAAAIMAVHPRALWASQEARPYAFVVLCALAAAHAVLQLCLTGRARWWAAYIAWSLAGLFTHVAYPFLLLGQWLVVAAWALRRRRLFPEERHLPRGAALGLCITPLATLALALPVFLWLRRMHAGHPFFLPPKWPGTFVYREALLNIFYGDYRLSVGSGFKYPGLAWLLLTSALAWRARRALEAHAERFAPRLSSFAAALAFSVPVCLILIAGLIRSSSNGVRYFAIGMAGGSLLIALSMFAPLRPRSRWGYGALWFAVLSWFAVGFLRDRGEEIRSGIHYIAQRRQADEKVLFCSGSGARLMADYYNLGADPLHINRDEPDQQLMEQLIDREFKGQQAFWILGYKTHDSPFLELCEQRLKKTHEIDIEKKFEQVVVWRFARRS